MANDVIRVGNVEIISFSDAELSFPVSAAWPSVPAKAWEANKEHLGDDGNWHPNMGCFAVRSGSRTIMVDTGVGPETGGALPGLMQAAGIRPEEVATVVFTHLHWDHLGWNMAAETGRPSPRFPNARHLIPKADFDFFAGELEQLPYMKGLVFPLVDSGMVDFVESELDITPELRIWSTPGHTPGHISILINSAGEKGIILGDVALSPAQAHETDWNVAFDVVQDQARATRHAVLDRLEQEGFTIAACHFPSPGFGKLVRLQGRRVWQPLK